ncbi:DUF4832 domain-containing protein [Verrucomicrobiota bacterium]
MPNDAPMEKSCWRDQFGPDEVIQRVRPAESFEYLNNPHRGTATFQRFNGDPVAGDRNDRQGPFTFEPFDGDPETLTNDGYPRTTLSYCRWIWADIEPEKGNIRWDVIGGTLAAARARGQTLQMRIQPYIGDLLPEWYWESGGTRVPESGKRKWREPDHNTPVYLEHWGDLVRAFGERYDGHPDLESFDIAYGGACGEGGGNCTPETAAALVDVYLESFKKTQLLSMLGTHGCTHAARMKDRKVGWRADCYGDVRADGKGVVPDHLSFNHMYDYYPREVVEYEVEDAWKTAPVTFETCWNVPHWHEKGWDIDWVIEQGFKYHPTVFMPKSAPIPGEWKEKIDAFDRRLGYRFVLRQMWIPLAARPGESFEARIWIDNVGVAPIYRPYTFAYRFRQGDTEEIVESSADVRAWMPDNNWFKEQIALPPTLQPGEVDIDIGIVDPDTHEPKVRFAVDVPCVEGWHLMAKMDVK